MYVPDWETLSNALARLVERGRDANEAKADLCGAMVDKKIKFQAKVRGEGERKFPRKHFTIPSPLQPEAIDWAESRPRYKWEARINRDRPPFAVDPFPREILSIEVWREDVDRVLLAIPDDAGRGLAARGRSDTPAAGQGTDHAPATLAADRAAAPRIGSGSASDARATGQSYVPLWIGGKDALALIKQTLCCDDAYTLAWLQQACRDRVVEGRERGRDADREWYARRELGEPDDGAWRRQYIRRVVQPDEFGQKEWHAFLDAFDAHSEFRRNSVLEALQMATPPPAAVVPEAASGSVAVADRPAVPPQPSDVIVGNSAPRTFKGNPRGKPPKKQERIVGEMLGDYASVETLLREKQETLAAKYGAVRSTVQRARRTAVARMEAARGK